MSAGGSADAGTAAVVRGWMEGVVEYLKRNDLTWDQVEGVGLAIPGPYKRYGVLDSTTNLPKSFEGWDFYTEYRGALREKRRAPASSLSGGQRKMLGVAKALAAEPRLLVKI